MSGHFSRDALLPLLSRVNVEIVAVVGISLIALVLRTWNLGQVPYGPLGDEASYALRAMLISQGQHLGIWAPDTLGVPSGHVWLMAMFFKLGEPTLFTARLLSALIGTLLVPVCFYMLRMHFSFRVAVTGAFMVATFSWLVVASRIGMPAMLSICSASVALLLLAYALRSGSNVAALASGILLGLTVYVFTLNFFYLVGISCFIVLFLVINTDLRGRKTLYLVLVPAWIVAIPMAHHYWSHPYWISGNLSILYDVNVSSLWNVSDHMARVGEIILHVHRAADVREQTVDALDTRAILPSLMGIAFWVGLLLALLGLWRARYNMLLAGWLVGMAPAVMVPGGDTRRYLLGVVFVLLIAAVGFHASLGVVVRSFLGRLGDRARSCAVVGCTVLFLVAFGAVNVYDVAKWPDTSMAQFLYTKELRLAGEFLDDVEPERDVRFYSPRWSVHIEAMRWFAPRLMGWDGSIEFGGDGTIFSGGVPPEGTVYMLLPGYLNLLYELQDFFPEGRYVQDADPDGRVNFIAFIVR